MTKAIKFNLILDNNPVRDLDDLRAHFNIDDLLTLYHDKVLHRWLDVRGLCDELKQVRAINNDDNKIIAKTLCEIFHTDLTQADIDTAVYSFEFKQKQKQQLEKLASDSFKRNAVIKDYHAGYEKLINEMIHHAEDYPFLKSAINALWQDYSQLFTVDFDLFFEAFIEKSPLTLFTMLTNDDYRKSGLFYQKRKNTVFAAVPNQMSEITEFRKERKQKEGKETIFKCDTNHTWKKITDEQVIIKGIVEASSSVKIKDNDGKEYPKQSGVGKVLKGLHFYSYNSADSVKYAPYTSELVDIPVKKLVKSNTPLPTYYQSYSGVTDGYWKDLEPKSKKCLILKMENGNFIRNSGKNGEELNAEAINEQFIILDGIDYKSNNANHTLIYMVI